MSKRERRVLGCVIPPVLPPGTTRPARSALAGRPARRELQNSARRHAMDDPLLSCKQQLIGRVTFSWAASHTAAAQGDSGGSGIGREVAGCATLAVFGAEHSPGGVDGGDPVDQHRGWAEPW